MSSNLRGMVRPNAARPGRLATAFCRIAGVITAGPPGAQNAARRWRTATAIVALVVLAGQAPAGPSHWAAAQARRGTAKFPDWSAVDARIVAAFRDATGAYRPLDLIHRGQVAGLFDELARIGFVPADREALEASVLADDHFLVQQLQTPAGVKFMRQMDRFPSAYDRLDRLSRLPRGQRMVRDLIRGPDGYKLLEYLTTTSGGTEMGKMLSQAPLGHDFNQATGRIYTAKALRQRLYAEYRAAQQGAAEKATSRKAAAKTATAR